MHQKTSFAIKNWKLTLLAFLFIGLFTSLGIWQIIRANQKRILLANYTKRVEHPPKSATDLHPPRDLRFYRVSLQGEFDNQYTFLLDNRTFYGQIGYEVFTLFKAEGVSHPLLVDRGFIPMEADRNKLPDIKIISGTIRLTGMLNTSPKYVAFGKIYDSPSITWPLRIEFIHLKEMAKLMRSDSHSSDLPVSLTSETIFPYLILITPHHAAAYPIEWKIVTMGPEKHLAYALQWFAIALTLLIIWWVLNKK